MILANEMNSPIVDDPISDFNYSINFDDASIKNATKFCQIRVIQESLIPSVKRFVHNVPYVSKFRTFYSNQKKINFNLSSYLIIN